MKKTALKRKTPLKRKSKGSERQLNDKVWAECKRITRERYGNRCYTCGKEPLHGSDWHTGHSKPKAALPLRFKYDIRGLRPQCYRCNVNLGGCTDIFIAKLEQDIEGIQFLNDACYYDKEANAWRIRQDIHTMGSAEARRFKEMLLEQYKGISYGY